MNRLIVRFLLLLTLGCSGPQFVNTASPGSSGAAALNSISQTMLEEAGPGVANQQTGGASTTGGSSTTGGASTTGGSSTTAGSSTTGDASTTGGSSTTAGSSAISGAFATGGASTTGGTLVTGGVSTTGGSPTMATTIPLPCLLVIDSNQASGTTSCSCRCDNSKNYRKDPCLTPTWCSDGNCSVCFDNQNCTAGTTTDMGSCIEFEHESNGNTFTILGFDDKATCISALAAMTKSSHPSFQMFAGCVS